jgi:hypothetical protein
VLQSLEAKATPVHMRVLQVFGAKAWRIKALPAAPGKFSIGRGSKQIHATAGRGC